MVYRNLLSTSALGIKGPRGTSRVIRSNAFLLKVFNNTCWLWVLRACMASVLSCTHKMPFYLHFRPIYPLGRLAAPTPESATGSMLLFPFLQSIPSCCDLDPYPRV